MQKGKLILLILVLFINSVRIQGQVISEVIRIDEKDEISKVLLRLEQGIKNRDEVFIRHLLSNKFFEKIYNLKGNNRIFESKKLQSKKVRTSLPGGIESCDTLLF